MPKVENTGAEMVGLDATVEPTKTMAPAPAERCCMTRTLSDYLYPCSRRESTWTVTIMTPRRRGKDIPRLPLSAFSPTSDTFPLPPTPSIVTPAGIVDAHLHLARDAHGALHAHTAHLIPARKRAVVLSSGGHSAEAIVASQQS